MNDATSVEEEDTVGWSYLVESGRRRPPGGDLGIMISCLVLEMRHC